MNSSKSNDLLSREEFDEFLNIFTHEIRNRLNMVGLEASDLAEQLEDSIDISRLQRRVRDCSELLKIVRDLAVPDDPTAAKLPLGTIIEKIRARDVG